MQWRISACNNFTTHFVDRWLQCALPHLRSLAYTCLTSTRLKSPVSLSLFVRCELVVCCSHVKSDVVFNDIAFGQCSHKSQFIDHVQMHLTDGNACGNTDPDTQTLCIENSKRNLRLFDINNNNCCGSVRLWIEHIITKRKGLTGKWKKEEEEWINYYIYYEMEYENLKTEINRLTCKHL